MDERRVLTQARRLFVEHDAPTIEDIAEAAGTDPAEVLDRFGSTRVVFMAAMRLDPDRDDLVGFLLDTLRLKLIDKGGEPMATIRAMLTDPDAVAPVRQAANTQADKTAAAMSGADREVRAAVLRSIMLGVGLGRDLLALRGLTSVSVEEIVAAVRPAFEAMCDGPITLEV